MLLGQFVIKFFKFYREMWCLASELFKNTRKNMDYFLLIPFDIVEI